MVVGELSSTPPIEAKPYDIGLAEAILSQLTDVSHFGGRRHGDNYLTHTLQQFLTYHQNAPGGAMIGRNTQPDLAIMVPEYTSMHSQEGGLIHGIAIPDDFSDLLHQNPAQQIKALIAAVVTARHRELEDFDMNRRPVNEAVGLAQVLFYQALERNPRLMQDLVDSEGFEPSAFSM